MTQMIADVHTDTAMYSGLVRVYDKFVSIEVSEGVWYNVPLHNVTVIITRGHDIAMTRPNEKEGEYEF